MPDFTTPALCPNCSWLWGYTENERAPDLATWPFGHDGKEKR